MLRLIFVFAFSMTVFPVCSAGPVNPVRLEKPADGAVIFDRKLEISGVAEDATRVAVLIQGMTKDQSWRVMSLSRPDADGRFSALIKLQGARYDVAYRIVIAAATGTYGIRTLKPGMVYRQPPSGLPHSDVIRVTVAGSARPGAKNDNTSERILLPVNGSTVGPVETVVIEGKGDPLPIVLISDNKDGSVWYPQAAVESVGPGRNAVKVQFGNKQTIAGDRFRLKIAIPKNKRERASLPEHEPIRELPKAIQYGAPTIVKFDPDKKPTVDFEQLKFDKALAKGSQLVRIVGPKNGAVVTRRTTITGLCDPSLAPILLVRTEMDKETWYVQPACEVSEGGFRGSVFLGRLGTAAGTRFQVVAFLVSRDKVNDWKSGEALPKLPENLPISKPLLLIHNGSDE